MSETTGYEARTIHRLLEFSPKKGSFQKNEHTPLNPNQQRVTRWGRDFRVGDKVMQIRNNYDKDVYNGDIGRIAGIDFEAQEVTISFDGRDVGFDFTDLDEIVLAYAAETHKISGSRILQKKETRTVGLVHAQEQEGWISDFRNDYRRCQEILTESR